MTLIKTFQAIEETRFLKTLSLQENLLFVGEIEPLQYIQNFWAKHQKIDRNFYYDLSSYALENLDNFILSDRQYQAIIVVSFEDETALFTKVRQKLATFHNIPIVRLFADVFINLMSKRGLLQPASDDFVKPKTAYAILTTPRSGSTYFCDLLGSTGVAGYPIEHLRLANQELALNCDFDYFRLLYNLMQYRVSDNGIFGTKLISHFLFELRKAKPEFRDIFQLFDKYILLVRQDKVAQAVSLVIAQKTNVWHLQKNIERNNPDYQIYQSALEHIAIDDELLLEVKQKHQFVKNQENRLRHMLKVNQIEPLEIAYEDVVENAPIQIGKILNFLEVPPSLEQIGGINSQIKKMPSELSQKIIQQYKARNAQSILK